MTSLAGRLLTYALGRELEFYDEPAVRRIIQQAQADGFGWTALVQAIVMSEPFQQRIKLPAPALAAAGTASRE